MTNPVFLWGYAHVLLASLVTGTVLMLAVSAWYLRRKQHDGGVPARPPRCRSSCCCPSIFLALGVGSHLGVIEATYQPMKIAAAEAQWETCQPCSFSVFQIGGGNNDQNPTKIIEIPHLLSILATGTWDGEVQGLNELNAAVPGGVRPRELRAERLHPVLVDARDGLPGLAGRPRRSVGRCG